MLWKWICVYQVSTSVQCSIIIHTHSLDTHPLGTPLRTPPPRTHTHTHTHTHRDRQQAGGTHPTGMLSSFTSCSFVSWNDHLWTWESGWKRKLFYYYKTWNIYWLLTSFTIWRVTTAITQTDTCAHYAEPRVKAINWTVDNFTQEPLKRPYHTRFGCKVMIIGWYCFI